MDSFRYDAPDASHSSMSELLARLTEREMSRLEAEKDARARIIEAMNEVTNKCEGLQQLRRSQDMEMKVSRAQMEKTGRDNAYKWRQEVHKASKELNDTVAQADSSKLRKSRALAHEKLLSNKAMELERQLRDRQAQLDDRIASLHTVQQARFDRVKQQNDERISSVAALTEDVVNASHAAVGGATETLQEQFHRSNLRSEGRTRFKELCDLSKSAGNYEMSKPAYYEMKDELTSLWHRQTKTPAPTKIDGARALTDAQMMGSSGASFNLTGTSRTSQDALVASVNKSYGTVGSTEVPLGATGTSGKQSPLHLAGTSTISGFVSTSASPPPDELKILEASLAVPE